MSDESNVVTELVAKIGLEPDAASFANADKMLDGIAGVMSQLVAALTGVTARLDVMAAHAAKAGEFLTGMFEGGAAAAAEYTAAASAATGVGGGGGGSAPLGPMHGPELPPDMQREQDVAAARAKLQAAQSKKEIEHLAKVDLGMVDYGPALPPGMKKSGAGPEAIGKAAEAAAPKIGLMQRALTGVGVAIAANFGLHYLENFAHGLISASSAIIGTSERLGISKAAVQELGFAAKIAEADVGTLETGLKFLQQNSAQAAKGSKGDAKAFSDLGVSVKDASGNVKNADVLFEEVADAISKLPTDAAKTAAAMQLFGRSGAQLLPILKLGGQGIRDLRAEAKALGGGLSDEVIEEADAFEDNLTRLDFAMQGLKSVIGNILLPVFSVFTEAMTKGVSAIKKLWTETKYLQTFAIVAFTALAAHSARAAASVALDWIVAAAPFIGLAVAVGVFALALEDIYQTMTGGKGQIGLWLDEWKGAGFVDSLVRDIAAGFESLNDALRTLSSFKVPEILKFLEESGDAHQKSLADAGRKGKRQALVAASKSKDPTLAGIAKRDLAKFDADNFGSEEFGNIPRATARGLGAGVLQQEAGRASIGSGAATHSTVNNVDVTVHAKTDADPKEIARHAGKAVEASLAKQNRNLRAAHARQ